MSSSQPFLPSSPISPVDSSSRRKSRFTYKHLSQLSLSSTSCPLRVIAHIDLDAFYAQCEMVRLGLPEDQPLAVQQWQGLIAINYPARASGMTRFINIAEAKKLCPNVILQHVATWREGDEKWAYHKDAFADIGTHKVSLDPYRLESRRILACIKGVLPAAPIQRVEKASVDEVFLDLSAQVHLILMDRFPEINGPAPYDDPSENLPRPSTTVLNWDTDALVDLDTTETEDDDPDWDDIAISIGSEIVRSVRAAIREQLKYTCSAGIARNKMIAKLGSAHKKPNQQTIVRNRAIQQFLSNFRFTKIRNLGGKLGEQVVSTFGTDEVRELLSVSLDQLKFKLGDDTGSWVYHIIRGEDSSEVNSRTQIKSMLSAKSFRPSINTFEQAVRWLRIFAADIFSRLVEEGVLENKRRPRTMNLHHRQGGQTRSRQLPIPSGKAIDEVVLFELAKTLLGQVVVDGRAWPCANLSLSVGGFEDGPTGNRGIGGFLVKGDEAKAMRPTKRDSEMESSTMEDGRTEKRRKNNNSGIQKFFVPRDSSKGEHDDDFGAVDEKPSNQNTPSPAEEDEIALNSSERHGPFVPSCRPPPSSNEVEMPFGSSTLSPSYQPSLFNFVCAQCSKTLSLSTRAEHEDWHFAKSLEASERATTLPPTATKSSPAAWTKGEESRKGEIVAPLRGPKKPGGGEARKVGEKGQRKLAFG